MSTGIPAIPRERIALAFKELRETLGFNQEQMAVALGVSQPFVGRIETGAKNPSAETLLRCARLAPSDVRPFWLEVAGFVRADGDGSDNGIIRVPVLRDPAAAGTPRAIDERNIAEHVSLPQGWLPYGGSLQAVRVVGESMAPVLLDGHIVIIDTAQRDPKSLVQQMVAARNDEDEVTIKWLRYSGGIFSLVPQHTSPEFEIVYLRPHGEFTIVGKIVKWIGEPPPPPKKRGK